jgi:thermitase
MKRLVFVLVAALVVSSWSPAALAAQSREGASRVPTFRDGAILVKYRSGTPELEKDRRRATRGDRAGKKFPSLNLEEVVLRPGKPVGEALREYEADEHVEYAEPDYIVQALATPNDPHYFHLWALGKINAPTAWKTSTGSNQVVVAVIDSGVDYTHPDLAANVFVNPFEANGTPGVDDDGNGVVDDLHGYNAAANTGDPWDDNGHGTHVAGTIGGVGNNGLGITGVNWNARILACKFLSSSGSGATSNAIACLQYVRALKDRGIDIVATSNSWGGGAYSRALSDAIRAQGDILFVAAAGNDAIDHDADPQYPADYELPNVLSVGSTDSADAYAGYSDFGRRKVHLAAPGVRILSTLPGGSYGYKTGTSMAAPHVAGLAALLRAARPTLDWREIKNLILAGGDPLSNLTEKTISGRRMNAAGSLLCNERSVFSAIKAPARVEAGVPANFSALSITCGSPAGPVTLTLSGGQTIHLLDDGLGADVQPGDGIFTATFAPGQSADVLQLFSPAGSETVGAARGFAIVTNTLPAASVGTAYAQALHAPGGTAPYAWALESGRLPAGLSLGVSSGTLSGTPTTGGTFTFISRVQDALGFVATKAFSLTVAEQALQVSTAALPLASLGLPYSVALDAAGGRAPYEWAIYSNRPPYSRLRGFSLDPATGVLSGSGDRLGTLVLTVRATDSLGTRTYRTLSLTVR